MTPTLGLIICCSRKRFTYDYRFILKDMTWEQPSERCPGQGTGAGIPAPQLPSLAFLSFRGRCISWAPSTDGVTGQW